MDRKLHLVKNDDEERNDGDRVDRCVMTAVWCTQKRHVSNVCKKLSELKHQKLTFRKKLELQLQNLTASQKQDFLIMLSFLLSCSLCWNHFLLMHKHKRKYPWAHPSLQKRLHLLGLPMNQRLWSS